MGGGGGSHGTTFPISGAQGVGRDVEGGEGLPLYVRLIHYRGLERGAS